MHLAYPSCPKLFLAFEEDLCRSSVISGGKGSSLALLTDLAKKTEKVFLCHIFFFFLSFKHVVKLLLKKNYSNLKFQRESNNKATGYCYINCACTRLAPCA